MGINFVLDFGKDGVSSWRKLNQLADFKAMVKTIGHRLDLLQGI
jgi:hypothetical protein